MSGFVAMHVYLMQSSDAYLTYTGDFVDIGAIFILPRVQDSHFHGLWHCNCR